MLLEQFSIGYHKTKTKTKPITYQLDYLTILKLQLNQNQSAVIFYSLITLDTQM